MASAAFKAIALLIWLLYDLAASVIDRARPPRGLRDRFSPRLSRAALGGRCGAGPFGTRFNQSQCEFTRRVVWSQFAPGNGHMSDRARRRKCFLITLTVTACLVLMLLVLGMGIAYAQGRWDQALAQVFTWHLLPAIGLFFPWALLQQALFQFYLLGRLRTVIPTQSPLFDIVLTGISYAMTHLPDLTVALVTSLMGVFWTSMYYRFRILTDRPLACGTRGRLLLLDIWQRSARRVARLGMVGRTVLVELAAGMPVVAYGRRMQQVLATRVLERSEEVTP